MFLCCFIRIYTGCMIAAGLSRYLQRVVQADGLHFYGGSDTSLPMAEICNIGKLDNVSHVSVISVDDEVGQSSNREIGSHPVDVTHPKILLGGSRSIKELIRLGVSGYLSFSVVRSIVVSGWELPLTRSKVFGDKRLRMQEKRALMELLKNVATRSNSAINSSSLTGGGCIEEFQPMIIPIDNITSVEYLASFHITRPELVYGLIHGVALFPGPANSLSASDFLTRVKQFAESLNVYEEGCAYLVPSYGNGDLPQAFARAAAVAGAVQILGCDMKRVRDELSLASACQTIPGDEKMHESKRYCVQRAVAFGKMEEQGSSDGLVLEIIAPNTFDETPIMCLRRRKGELIIFDLFSFSDDHEKFTSEVEQFLVKNEQAHVTKKVTFQVGNTTLDPLHAFSIEQELNASMQTINALLELPLDQELPESPQTVEGTQE